MWKIYDVKQIKEMRVGEELFVVYLQHTGHNLEKFKVVEVDGVKCIEDIGGFVLTINELIQWFTNGSEIFQETRHYHDI